MDDHRYHCSDCDSYNLCEYYDKRKPTSLICKEFRYEWNHIEKLKEIRQEIYKSQQAYALKGLYTESNEDYGIHVGLTMALQVVDKHIAESEEQA